MDYNYLYHWGIKGMKWGVRRYQNEDGTLTNAGKKRYYSDVFDAHDKGEKIVKDANGDRWVQEDLTRSRKLVNETAEITRNLKTLNDDVMKNKPKIQMDLSNMTDQEMREQINRKLLERQYNDLFAPQNTSRGQEVVSQVLGYAGTTLAIGSSALGIALAIKQLKG